MKQILSILTLFLALSFTATAQSGPGRKDSAGNKVAAIKIAYLTSKLNLSPEEAQKFWPIYNKYAEELRKVRNDARKNNTPELEVEEKVLAIRKKYNSEFSKALPPEKVNAFYKAEKEFGTMLKKEWMERKKKRGEKGARASE